MGDWDRNSIIKQKQNNKQKLNKKLINSIIIECES